MLGFVQNWFAVPPNPIGIDFGTDCLRLAQAEPVSPGATEFRLVAAASAEVPQHLHDHHNAEARFAFFTEAVRDLLAQGNFRGRRAVLSIPAASLHISHLRMPRLDEEALLKALPWEARGKLPFDANHALLRHIVAGDVHQGQQPQQEIILLATRRDRIDQYLVAAARARLDVVGLNAEPKAIVDCFSNIYRRKADSDVTNCFVDIGSCATRVVIARGRDILFARVIPLGGDHFNIAVASALKISRSEARLLRIKLCASQGPDDHHRDKQHVLTEAAIARSSRRSAPSQEQDGPEAEDALRQHQGVEKACGEPLAKLTEELALCRSNHEATFPNRLVDRLIFIGGESRHRGLCQQIARGLSVAAQVGDPLVRMGRISDVGIESGIDRRRPQPGWPVAIGLTIGPARSEQTAPIRQERQ